MENEEDLQELEVRLYSQVHHDAVEPGETAAAENAVDLGQSTDPVNDNGQSGNVVDNSSRYWAKGDKPAVSQHRKFVRSGPESSIGATASTSGAAAPPFEAVADNEPDAGATLLASGGGPEKKRSINPFSVANARKKPKSKGAAQINQKSRPGNFEDRKLRKLEQNKKIHQKRLKSRMARMKSKKTQETIVLESSDEDDGDVVVVPIPPPPIVTLESSDEGEDDGNGESFAKPSDPRQPSERKVGTGGSRCNSPNSVMSDDFIGQQDKTRLLSETNIPDDHELQCPTSEPGSAHGAEKVLESASHQSGNFATPTKRVSRLTRQKQASDYQVTQANIGAVDVYESESSDMPESVYQKGNRNKVGAVNKSSGSDVEEVEAVAKTKRLRKRRASSSNKGSEPNDDSTDSEEGDHSATSIPYIARGEAIENCKRKMKSRTISSRDAINADDREFIDKLSNIARGHDDTVADLDESHGSNHSAEADITAREIAEDVLKQANKESNSNDDENAIPSDAIKDLALFDVIDTISTQLDDFKEPPRHGRDPTPELQFEDLTERYLSSDEGNSALGVIAEKSPSAPKVTGENKLDFMHVVYTNRDHVTWNEEMVRFYEHSWQQERFNVDRILRLMDRRADWHILNADRFPVSRKFTNMKCNNCCEFGHHRNKCPLPRKDLTCFVCGDVGHKEPRCPNAVCLRCGKKTNVFTRSCQNCIMENSKICPICKIRGHSIDLCPDKWRRYHSTTAINEHPNSQVFYNERKACCICGGRGHLPEHCRSSNKLNEYHAPLSEIRYHSKTYEDIKIKEPFFSGAIGVHLMSSPEETVTFPFSKKVTKNQYYGRFLAAVDLFDAPESKIVRNYVLNPFAKRLKKEDKKIMKKQAKRRKLDKDDNSIQLNISGGMEVPEEMDVTENVDVNLDENALDALEQNKVGVTEDSAERKSVQEGGKAIDVVALDTDSNYSFSEHFPSNEKNDGESLSTLKIDRSKGVGQLPDFIPISGDSEMGTATKSERKVGPLPDFISLGDSDEDNDSKTLNPEGENIEGKGQPEESCEGKIYPSKFHSQFLLSPEGTKFLVESSREHNVKVIMDWSAVGNVLVIHGLPSNQDKFHTALMEKMKAVSDDKNRKTLEQSQKLPRARDNLIKVLQESILQLEKDLGDVIDLHKKMKFNEGRSSKSNFKLAEKYRRTLNMILMGQAGLRDGQMHLSNLQDKLRELKGCTNNEPVTLDLREQIEKHYRYIFSSFQHGCYEQLIRVYMNMKKTNNLPELKLDYKLLGKKVLDTNFTKEQMEKLMQPPQPPKINQNIKQEQTLESIKTPRTEFGLSPQKQVGHARQKSGNQSQTPPRQQQQAGQSPLFRRKNQFQNVPLPPPFHIQQPTTSNSPNYQHPSANMLSQPMKPSHRQFPFNAGPRSGSGTFVANKIREINKKWDNETNNLLNQVSSTPMKAGMKPSKNSSCFWSRECLKFIARCMSIQGLQDSITEKLNQLSQRAAGNMLSFADFKAVKRIYFNLLKAEQKSLHSNR